MREIVRPDRHTSTGKGPSKIPFHIPDRNSKPNVGSAGDHSRIVFKVQVTMTCQTKPVARELSSTHGTPPELASMMRCDAMLRGKNNQAELADSQQYQPNKIRTRK